MERYVCVHGHFYQPPRENPWLEDVELQDSAYPYHDWNARITAECYEPNAASRLLDNENRIIDIISNYQQMSFNFGPTLLSWMQVHAPEVYAAIIDSDKKSVEKFSGHGSAIAQAYNHMIMPLANNRDKLTQVLWGIKDFKYRFGREPEGMWLPEAAVDTETLETLAECGIKFTILAPRQAHQVRKIGEDDWHDVSNATVDPKQVYKCPLPSGKSIALFFYDGPISGAVISGGLLKKGEDFANSMLKAFTPIVEEAELVHIAVDGETFGHHYRYADMALAYCLHYIESKGLAKITNYAEYLEKFRPEYEAKIFENSSWSCAHGIERWRADCGCNTGGHPDWNQKWRAPLRAAMDYVRDATAPIYEREMAKFAKDPWKVRNEYIDVILDRSEHTVQEFIKRNITRQITDAEKTEVLKLLEMQRHCLLMYTSCGWFFDELSGIEGVQVMMYAQRAMQLAKQISGEDFENNYKAILEKAPSNLPQFKNGGEPYEKYVRPAAINLHRVGAHYAISSLFDEHPASYHVYCYWATNEKFQRWEIGSVALITGRAKLKSNITLEEYEADFAVLHLFEQNIYGGIAAKLPDETFEKMNRELEHAFNKSDISDVILIMNNYFGRHNYSLWYLFRDEQRKIINKIFTASLKEVEFAFRYIYERHYSLMQAMREVMMPLPKSLLSAAEFILNSDLQAELEKEETDTSRLSTLVNEIKKQSFELDKTTVGYEAGAKINSLAKKLYKNPENMEALTKLEKILHILTTLPHDFEIWKAQNICFEIRKKYFEQMSKKAQDGDANAKAWIDSFSDIAEHLDVKVG